MRDRIFKSIQERSRNNPTFDERWNGSDNGLITCWEVGRNKIIEDPELARKASRGELPVLGWKGGVKRKLKNSIKYGSLYYLAQWQGLRGEDLNIDPNIEIELTCSKTYMKVIYTSDASKYVTP